MEPISSGTPYIDPTVSSNTDVSGVYTVSGVSGQRFIDDLAGTTTVFVFYQGGVLYLSETSGFPQYIMPEELALEIFGVPLNEGDLATINADSLKFVVGDDGAMVVQIKVNTATIIPAG